MNAADDLRKLADDIEAGRIAVSEIVAPCKTHRPVKPTRIPLATIVLHNEDDLGYLDPPGILIAYVSIDDEKVAKNTYEALETVRKTITQRVRLSEGK